MGGLQPSQGPERLWHTPLIADVVEQATARPQSSHEALET